MTAYGFSEQVFGGKYRLGDLIGKGGFGVVYRAEHLDLHRQQAIKILLEQYLNDPKYYERFLREAHIVANMDHKNIVHIDDIGTQEIRRIKFPYLVMPFISGGTLEDLLRDTQGLSSLEDVSHFLEDICNALEYAHSENIAHLDLKPRNLLLHQDGRLMLTDFGLAHFVSQNSISGGTSLNHGTPRYMAPEHLAGRPDRRSDIFSVGVLLAEMLLGLDVFNEQLPAECPRPQLRSRPEIPAGIEDVLGNALAKQIKYRYQTAADLLTDFKRAMNQKPTAFNIPISDRNEGATGKIDTYRNVETPTTNFQATQIPPGTSFLYVEEGGNRGAAYPLPSYDITLGRSRERTYFINDVSVSRAHATIQALPDGSYAIRDDGSVNGTRLNGTFLKPHVSQILQDQDQIYLGSHVLVFVFNNPSWNRPTPAPPSFIRSKGNPTPPPSSQHHGAGTPRLLIEIGREPGRTYALTDKKYSIGSNENCNITLNDPDVESWHASILRASDGTYSLKHESMLNLTKINGQVIKRFTLQPLQNGDRIQIGQHVLVFSAWY
ncbi:FHA domain-containing serine/threonine-protein kinase [Tengunoibacter tsumagoiensis]|uniref:non-specific serine/threonine protein kinase n=1 Tax=Tengunoibacter tsumagoiensis TaxID=2014871 RepID=A0A401ZUA4_9CHLR|nr:FHA domain-containing serine/threonine-protein kinase [Tengunoibacter tsumagoiensis]GCE10495.1 hypothetical protein KTT_03540 [Tengunoibacter tsumagoiensis]